MTAEEFGLQMKILFKDPDPGEKAIPGEFGKGLVTPVGSKVLVVEPPKKTDKAVLVMPDGSEDPHNSPTGIVRAVGPYCRQVKVGDVVFLNPSSVRQPIGRSREVGYILLEDQLLGVWRPQTSASDDPVKPSKS